MQAENPSARNRRGRRTVIVVAVAIAVVIVVLVARVQPWLGRSDALDDLRAAASGFNLLLVTLDTTRADRIGCYGYSQADTPTLDGLAQRGVRFAHAFTPVPVTLPSHCTIFTGLQPNHHGVRNNGRYRLATEYTTLAEILQGGGYDTAAFVASFPLDARFGLEQGFEVYDFEVAPEGRSGPNTLANERHAGHVTTSALTWLSAREPDAAPFFAWVHYFDPHAPYAPPSSFRNAHPPGDDSVSAAYDSEIAFVDSQLRRLLDQLDRQGLRRRTLVVIVSDHGEGLGQHGEDEHGGFLYDETTRVAWLISNPDLFHKPRVVGDRIVGTVDMLPTICDVLGLPIPSGLDGVSQLAKPFDPGRALYLETLLTSENYACAPLFGLRRMHDKLIMAPRPEYYDLRNDAGELQNRWRVDQGAANKLSASLEKIQATGEAGLSSVRSLEDDEVRRLASLGYISARSSADADSVDPKDQVPLLSELRRAIELHEQNNTAKALLIVEEIMTAAPALDVPVLLAASIHTQADRRDEATGLLERFCSEHATPEALIALARQYFHVKRFDDMERALQAVESIDPQRGVVPLIRGDRYMVENRFDLAVKAYEQALTLDAERIGPHGQRMLQLAREHASR